MIKIILIIGMIVSMNTFAVAPKISDEFLSFDDAEKTLSILSTDKSVGLGTLDETKSLIKKWETRNCRKESIALLKENGFDITNEEDVLVIEWGGGGVLYRVLYLSKKIFFIAEGLGENEFKIKTIANTAALADIKKAIKTIAGKDEYHGDISGCGCGFSTYILTIPDNARKEKTVVIYGGAVPETKEKNTTAILELIMKMFKDCGIEIESGS